MKRPLYETEQDLESEKALACIIQDKWKCKLMKLPIRYHLDFAAVRDGEILAFCEIKTRNYTMEKIGSMGGYLMSVGKWTSAHTLNQSTSLPFILIVKALDGVYHASFDAHTFKPDKVFMRGRTDREDWQDIEPCVLLNVNKFKPL